MLQKINLRNWLTIFQFSSILTFSICFLTACNDEAKPKKQTVESLTEIKDGIFTEYYPGKKKVKFQGALNDNTQREGKWVFYAENGVELSITFYEAGKKDGHTIVKYPNGSMYYYGEYANDKKIGVWKTYGVDGKIVNETDFGAR